MAGGYLNSKVSGLGWLKNGLSWDCRPNVQALQHGRLRVAGVSGFQDEHPQERGRSSMAFYDSASEDTWLTGDFPHALPASAVITARLKGMESQNPPLDGRRGENVQQKIFWKRYPGARFRRQNRNSPDGQNGDGSQEEGSTCAKAQGHKSKLHYPK